MEFLTFREMRERGLRADYHMHSVYSDGDGTIEENARAAAAAGLAEIGLSDHMWRSSDWIPTYVAEIRRVESGFESLRLRAGGEAKAIDFDGNVDIAPENARLLDYVTGAVHAKLPLAEDPTLRDIRDLDAAKAAEVERDVAIAMCHNPMVHAIAHPLRAYYKFHYRKTTEAPFPEAYTVALLEAAAATDTAVEVYVGDPQLERTLALYADIGVRGIPASDAHQAERVGRIPYERIFAMLSRSGGDPTASNLPA